MDDAIARMDQLLLELDLLGEADARPMPRVAHPRYRPARTIHPWPEYL